MRITRTQTLLLRLCTCLLMTVSLTHAAQGDAGSKPFHCPDEHVYIYCGELHSNLDYYGYPKPLYGYGSIQVYGPEVHEHLDKCGKGKITRRWKIKHHYDWYWCEQTIHIKEPHGSYGSFDGHKDVHWPKDYDMKECEGDMHPDHLPHGYNWPKFQHHGCAKLGLRYADKVYPYSHGHHGYGYGYGHRPCKVVHRTWELIDWCQYNSHYGSYGHPSGKWTYVQKIYLHDHEAPEITSCPDNIKVEVSDCDAGKVYVEIPKITAKDNCGEVYYAHSRKFLGADDYSSSHNSQGGGVNYSGPDASGYFHPGKTLVTLKAFDICGNKDECEFIVEVVAKDNVPPSVIGISSVTASLMMADTNDGTIEIWPEEFNSSSYDNCTAPEDLKFRLEPSTFTCEDYGPNEVKFIVEDEAGNSAYITVEVIIQANSFPCLGGVVSGNVMADANQGVDQVEVTLMQGMTQMTDAQGAFQFDDIPLGQEIYISGHKDTDPLRGVDMYDYAILSLHVDGYKEIEDPKRLIAADIDGSGVIDFMDLRAMRRLITGIDQNFTSNTSWKIYDARFEFADTTNPLTVELPAYYEIKPYNGGDMRIEFEAIKIGDVASAHLSAPVEEDAGVGESILVVKDRVAAPGEVFSVPFTFDQERSANSISFTLDLDPTQVEIMEIDGGSLEQKGHLDFVQAEEGDLAAIWYSLGERTFNPDEVLFAVTLRATRSVALSRGMQINSTLADAKTFGISQGDSDIQLRYQSPDLGEELKLYQNSPNPFKEETNIAFYVAEPGQVQLTIKDANGKTFYRHSANYAKGLQQVTVRRSELRASGLLFYELQQGNLRRTKKMLQL